MTGAQVRDRVLDRSIVDEMQHSFLDYSMSVIVRRALPDVRDGLKPVHRRILFAMHDLGLAPDRSYKKCATVVGEVLGKYHPHGDAAVYDALVRMVQDFSLRYPLLDGQGNFGSIDGDPAAAYRYTEARLAPAATELLTDIEKDTVAWETNFDDQLQEPTVLPAGFPGLLVNGSSGIAVGMSTNVPPHNLAEVAGAIRILVSDPKCSNEALMEALPGPDFPTGGFIVGTRGIRSMYETGRGRMTIRARVVTESVRGGRRQLVVAELPYAVSKSRIIAQIAGLARNGSLPELAGLRDESDREGIRLVVELKRGTDVGATMALLFRRTSLQTTFGAIMLALDGGRQPREFKLRELLERYRDHRLEVIRRRSRFDLERAEAELHIVQGLLMALARIDEVIAEIRASGNRAEARQRLVERFGLSVVQADAILNMRLARLTALEGDGLRRREEALRTTIEGLLALLGSEQAQLERMLAELDDVVSRFGDERRTEILPGASRADLAYVESSEAAEDVVVTLSRQKYVKRMSVPLYQRRMNAGSGLADMDRYADDYLERLVVARSDGWLLGFTAGGMVRHLRVADIPESSRSARGRSVWALLGVDRRDPLAGVLAVEDLADDRCVVFATRRGLVKRTRLGEYSNPVPGGLIGARVRPGDAVVDVALTSGDSDVLLLTRGRGIRFMEDQVPVTGRVSQGVKGVGLADDDRVVAMLTSQRAASALLVTEDGVGTRVATSDFPLRNRGGLGVLCVPTWGPEKRRAGPLVAGLEVMESDRVMLVSASGRMTPAAVKDVEVAKRSGRGVVLVRTGMMDRIDRVTLLQGDPGIPEAARGDPQFELMERQ